MTNQIIFKAAKTAALLHKSQLRKDGTPYIEHPISVAQIVGQYTKDPEVIAAALLHDVLEDVSKTIYSQEQFIKNFGKNIHRMVVDMSDKLDPISDAEESATWKERKLKKINQAENFDADTLLIFCADKIHNCYDFIRIIEIDGPDFWKTFHTSREEELWYYESCLSIVRKNMPGELADEFASYYKKLRKL
jgi:(p)ppGpp synthase/HD superfamily hydrolase